MICLKTEKKKPDARLTVERAELVLESGFFLGLINYLAAAS